jgi:putative Mn2+ efflux pump MntP
MTIFDIIIIAIGLAMDAAAVSLAAAASGYASDARAKFRLSFHFGLFQFFMPVVGWLFGKNLVSYIKPFDQWIAFFLLFFVGIRMIYEGTHNSPEKYKKDPSKGITMVMLSLATSIDALAVGLSFAMLEVNIWFPSILIGVITTTLSLFAIFIGTKLNVFFGKRMEIIGGIILIAIGFRILFYSII